jgi:HSP20 family molecular chaperone IbpA
MINLPWTGKAYGMTATGKRFLSAGELNEWQEADQESVWTPEYELIEASDAIHLTVELPDATARDIQIALLPKAVILKKRVHIVPGRGWKENWEALKGAKRLFRRFDLPALIDVNRVKAELELGVLTIYAPKETATEPTAKGVPGQPRTFVA